MSSSFENVQAQLRQVSLESRAKGTGAGPLSPLQIEALLQQGKAIYGSDSRLEAAAGGVPSAITRAVCVLATADRLQASPGGYVLRTESFGAKYKLCSGERFRDQPLLGYGTGFLVAPDVIATAGHCAQGFDVSSICALFDFEVRQGKTDLDRSASSVYFAAEVLDFVVEPDGADYAFIRLNRPVTGAAPLKIRKKGVKQGTSIYVVGHPVGLPKKVARDAQVLDNTPPTHFLANLDTFGGNSGSPVLTADDNEVCGILVRGAPDFVSKGTCYVATTFPLDQAGEAVCRATVWGTKLLKTRLSGQFDVSSAEDDFLQIPPQAAATPNVISCRQGLERFLCSAFGVNDLRQLVRNNLLLEPLLLTTHWDRALLDVVAQMVELLENYGLIDDDFFELLKAARPRRAEEIEKLRGLCVVRAAIAPAKAPPKQSAGRQGQETEVAAGKKTPSKRAIDRSSVYTALLSLAPGDFARLLEVEIDSAARLAVSGRYGSQSDNALSLISHYDVPYRTLEKLAEAIRGVAPDLI